MSSCLEFLPSVETAEKDAVILQETFRDEKTILVEFNIDRFAGREVAIQIDYEKVLIITMQCFPLILCLVYLGIQCYSND